MLEGLLVSVGPAVAQEEEEPQGARPSLRAHPLRGAFRLYGVLSEPDWDDAESIADLITIEPEEGGVPAGRTVIKVLVGPTDLIIGVVWCHAGQAHGYLHI